jgi:hypothetical protein
MNWNVMLPAVPSPARQWGRSRFPARSHEKQRPPNELGPARPSPSPGLAEAPRALRRLSQARLSSICSANRIAGLNSCENRGISFPGFGFDSMRSGASFIVHPRKRTQVQIQDNLLDTAPIARAARRC